MKKTVEECLSRMKISSCVEVNQRSINNFAGLKNLGSICYINSMMQQLFCNKTFRYLVMRIKDGKNEELVNHKGQFVDDNILHQVQKIFGYL
jgi:ubiquitin carboxyl-terminal hydrolase 34